MINLSTLYQTIFRKGKKILAGAKNFDASAEGLVPVEGGSIYYRRIGPKGKTPLIVIHGGPGFPHDYLLPLADARLGREIIFYDQLGCGRSERPVNAAFWRVERFVFELETLCEFLGLESVHLLGHSWGSIVALECAFGKLKVESLILASPCNSIERWRVDAAHLCSTLSSGAQQALSLAKSSGDFSSPEALAALNEYYQRFVYGVHPYQKLIEMAAAGFGTACYNAMWGPNELTITGTLKDFDDSELLKKFNRPVLCTCGRFDEVRPETCEWYAGLAARGRNHVFELSAHSPHLNETQQYVKVVVDFLDEVDQQADRQLSE